MNRRIQFVLTEEQYEKFMSDVKNSKLSISQYVVSKVLPDKTSFETMWEEFVNKLKSFPVGIDFDVAIIMGQDRWSALTKSEKLSIARLFNKKVATGVHDECGESDDAFDYRSIVIIGRSSSNVTRYRKIA